MNRYLRDTSIGQRQITVAPLPFKEMYTALQEKQSRYDAAEELEIKAKSSVSALSSPIPGYQQYLDGIKENYLTKALELHNSNPDKGNPNYRRRLNELIGEVEADRNLQLIQRDNEIYKSYIKDKSDAIKNGEYAQWRDVYSNFTGIDEKTGTVLPFVYAGLPRAKKVDELLNQAIRDTPEEEFEKEAYDKTGTKLIKTRNKGKNPSKLKYNIISRLGEDGLRDLAEMKGVKDINKYLNNIVTASSGISTSYSEKYDFARNKEAREQYEFNSKFANTTAPREYAPTGEILAGFDPLKEVREAVTPLLTPDGEISDKPDFSYSFKGGLASKGAIENLGAKDNEYKSPLLLGTTKSQAASNRERIIKTLKEKAPDTWKNFLEQSANEDVALKKAIKFLQANNTEFKLHQDPIVSKEESDYLNRTSRSALFYDMNGNPIETSKVVLDDDGKDRVVFPIAKLAPNPKSKTSVDGRTTYFDTYKVSVGGNTYIAAIPTTDRNIILETERIYSRFAGAKFGDNYVDEQGNEVPYTDLTTSQLLGK